MSNLALRRNLPKAGTVIWTMSLKPWETFLLLRLVRTLKGSQVIKLLEAIEDNKTIRDNSEETMDLVVQMPNKD
jgi:hypothetical protein